MRLLLIHLHSNYIVTCVFEPNRPNPTLRAQGVHAACCTENEVITVSGEGHVQLLNAAGPVSLSGVAADLAGIAAGPILSPTATLLRAPRHQCTTSPKPHAKAAVLKLQSVQRGKQSRRITRELNRLRQEDLAARRIQRAARRRLARRETQGKRQERLEKAKATKLQA